jgi:hypothetical protein
MRTRLPVVATARKLQTNNWQQPIKNGCLKETSKPGFGQYLSTEIDHFKSHSQVHSKRM